MTSPTKSKFEGLQRISVGAGSRHQSRAHRERFIMKIPLRWKAIAIHLPGQASAVGDWIWYQVGMKRSRGVELSLKAMTEEFGLSACTCRRGLLALESEGLISVERRRGRKSIVTVLKLANAKHSAALDAHQANRMMSSTVGRYYADG